jgi:ParB-like chromosome segregation protein Spo0J
MEKIKIHPAAELLPELEGSDFIEFLKRIQYQGQKQPIIIWEETGQLVDGRNRLKVCNLLNIDPIVEARSFKDEDEVIEYIFDANLSRRHLSKEKRAFIAADLAKLKKGRRKKKDGMSQAEAAKKMGVSRSFVQKAKRIKQEGSNNLVEQVKEGKLSISAAYELIKLSKEEQDEQLTKGKAVDKAQEIKFSGLTLDKMANSFVAYCEKRGFNVESLINKLENKQREELALTWEDLKNSIDVMYNQGVTKFILTRLEGDKYTIEEG